MASGVNSIFGSREGNMLSGSDSRVSSASVPQTPRIEGDILQSTNVRDFTFAELQTATRNFRPDGVLCEGGFGSVFKGWIDEHTYAAAEPGTGIVIAVKKLNLEGFHGHKTWVAEVNYLSQLSHPNLVKLIGYCLEEEQRLRFLVYEFMPQGSLEKHLFCRDSNFQPFPWNLRMKIALGAAKGLAFLHSDEANVIYCGFKIAYVLLDSHYNAKLCDFGLTKDGPTDDDIGTDGYASPEYLATGHLTTKGDVYCFGVMLLEMLSGRRAVDNNRPAIEHNLVEWARSLLRDRRKIIRILDPRLRGQYSQVGAQKAVVLALQCLSTHPKERPTMEQVVSELEQLQDAKDIVRNPQAGPTSGQKISSHSDRSQRRSSTGARNENGTHSTATAAPVHS